jgi:hypothetical protein
MYIGEELVTTFSGLDIVEDENREHAERLGWPVDSVLSMVQDNISENLRIPWPSIDGRHMAPPGVRVDTEFIHLWYGEDERTPVISMPAIRIADLMSDVIPGS